MLIWNPVIYIWYPVHSHCKLLVFSFTKMKVYLKRKLKQCISRSKCKIDLLVKLCSLYCDRSLHLPSSLWLKTSFLGATVEGNRSAWSLQCESLPAPRPSGSRKNCGRVGKLRQPSAAGCLRWANFSLRRWSKRETKWDLCGYCCLGRTWRERQYSSLRHWYKFLLGSYKEWQGALHFGKSGC